MSAPNVELLDYNWGYRKLAVANVEIAELKATIAELRRDETRNERDDLRLRVKELEWKNDQQEAVISQMRAAVETRFNEKIHSFKADEFRNYCYCGYYESRPIHTFAALGKQENDSAK